MNKVELLKAELQNCPCCAADIFNIITPNEGLPDDQAWEAQYHCGARACILILHGGIPAQNAPRPIPMDTKLEQIEAKAIETFEQEKWA